MIIGEIRVKRVESVDEVRTFIHMTPTFVSVRSVTPEDEVPIQATLEVEDPEELADAEEIEQFVSPPPTPKVTEEVPIGLTEAKLIYEAVNTFGPQGESMAKSKLKELKAQYDRLNIPIDIATLVKTAAKELNVDITGYEKAQAKLIEDQVQADLLLEAEKKAAAKPTPPKKRTHQPRKKKESPYVDQFKYINEVLGSFEGAEDEVNISLLPLPVWDILLLGGYCYEPQPGKILSLGSDYQLDAKAKKALHKFFKKNPDMQLRPPAIEDVEKAITKKLKELKEVVPNASPEHLKPMLGSFNLDAPLELITKIWETL